MVLCFCMQMSMKVTAKTLIPAVVIVLLTVGAFMTRPDSHLYSNAFTTLPQTVLKMLVDMNFTSSFDDPPTGVSSTESSLLGFSSDAMLLNASISVPGGNRTLNINDLNNNSSQYLNRSSNTKKTTPISTTNFSKVTPKPTSSELANMTETSKSTYYVTAFKMRVGRLGNQMFRYASLLGIARSQGRKLIIAPGSDLERTFMLSHVTYNAAARQWPVISEPSTYSTDTRLMNLPKRNWRIQGYLQSIRYFSSSEDEVRKEFRFRESVLKAAATIVESLIPKNSSSLLVGVHARRGDFLSGQRRGYAVPQKSYFMNAFQWMRSKFPGRNLTFLVTSDDLGWVRANLESKDVVVVLPASPGVHMAVLSSCEHMVISGGTFGWWSGWLAGGYVVYFTGFMAKGTTFGNIFVPSDYYPPSWVGLGN